MNFSTIGPMTLADVAREMARAEFVARAPTLATAADLTRQVLETKDYRKIVAASWVVANGLRGVFRKEPAVKMEDVPPPSEGFRFASDQPVVLQLLRATCGEEHVVYNLWGLLETFRSIGLAQGEYARIAGLKKYLEDYRAVQNGADRLPGDSRFIEAIHGIFSEWVMRYARANGLNVRFEGLEKVPKEGHVVYALAPHRFIYPDFFLTHVDPMLVPLAAANNFRDNAKAKTLGVPIIVDKLSLPLVDRDDPYNEERMKHLIDASITYGIRPAWFINGTRVERAFRDDGTLDRAGIYSSMPEKKNPERFVQTGVFMNALQLAKKEGKPVTILVVTLSGDECMPKEAKKFPFIQKNRSGGEIVYRVVDSIVIQPTDRQKKMPEVMRAITRLVREDLQIDVYLKGVVTEWGWKRGYNDLEKIFEERSGADDRYLIIADRIRSIPPSVPDRERFQRRLLDLLNQEATPEKRDVGSLLEDVSKVLQRR